VHLSTSAALVRGSVPGSKGAWIFVRDAVKHLLPENAPRPAGLKVKDAVSVEEITPAVVDTSTVESVSEAQAGESE